MQKEQIIQQAQFNEKVCTYWLLSGALTMTLTVVGIPLLLLWFPLGLMLTKRYLASMECTLTSKALKVKKGILVKVEKTIPLEKITDMGMVQGPVMRYFDLYQLTVETAGQSSVGSLVSLTGIVNASAFREKVLNQRDASNAKNPSSSLEITSGQPAIDQSAILLEIRDSLLRIEEKLNPPQP